LAIKTALSFLRPSGQDQDKLRSALGRTLIFCTERPWIIIVIAGLLTIASWLYTARHFAIDTDIDKLVSSDVLWRKRELAFSQIFPQQAQAIFAVVEAPSAELTAQATTALMQRLSRRHDLFRSVDEPGSNPFFLRNGLLYQPTDGLRRDIGALTQAQPLIKVLATDPSLRGLSQALLLVLSGVSANLISLDDLTYALNTAAVSIEEQLAGRFASFSWRALMRGEPPHKQAAHMTATTNAAATGAAFAVMHNAHVC
jgi:uncharacterized protein